MKVVAKMGGKVMVDMGNVEGRILDTEDLVLHKENSLYALWAMGNWYWEDYTMPDAELQGYIKRAQVRN